MSERDPSPENFDAPLDQVETALGAIIGLALRDAVRGTRGPELTEQLYLRLWELLTRTTVALAVLDASTPREVLSEAFKHIGSEEESRADIERRLERLERFAEGSDDD